MSQLPSQFYRDYSGGTVTNVNESLAPKNSVELLLNCDADEELGSAVTRLGTSIVGSQLVSGNSVLGLSDFRDADGSNHALVAAINAAGGATSVVYKVGTGTIRTGLTASKKMRFVNFLDSILMVNGADAEASYDGSSVITTGGAFDLANIPSSNTVSLALEWLDRVYVAGDTAQPDRLYYSSTPVSGAISWTSGNGYVDIEAEDGGGGIKALGKVPGYLLIFKERAMKRWNFTSAFPETLVEFGTPSQESVVMAGGLCAFFSASNKDSRGFYITNGGRPVPISHDRPRNIKKWIDAIPQASEANVAGIGTSRFFMWSIGDVTVDGIAYTNVVVRWNRILDQWSVRTYPSEFKVFSTYVSSGSNLIVGGDDNGQVINIDATGVYTDYSGKPIQFEILHHEENFGFNQKKELSEHIIVNSKNMENAVVEVRGMSSNQVNTDTIKGRVSEVKLKEPVRDNVIQIAVRGTVNGARGVLKEIEMPNVNVTKNY